MVNFAEKALETAINKRDGEVNFILNLLQNIRGGELHTVMEEGIPEEWEAICIALDQINMHGTEINNLKARIARGG